MTYEFSVQAINTAGTSDLSDIASATPVLPPATAPSTPTAPFGVAGNGQVNLAWTAPSSDGGAMITDYIVRYSVAGSGVWTVYDDGVSTATSTTVTGLTNGTAYVFTVAAANAVGTSIGSATSANVTPVSPVNELLNDPGFENGWTGWVAFNVGNFSQVTSPVRSGSKALKITATSTAVNYVGMTSNDTESIS